MKRIIECWDGPTVCKCSTCGADTSHGMELTRFDSKLRQTVERLGRFVCPECYRQSYVDYKARRKAQLDALPRCECPGCSKRATFNAARGVLLCGRQLKRAQAGMNRVQAGAGGLALFIPMDYDRADVLRWAQGGGA